MFLKGLMLFYVLGGVEKCYLFVLCIIKQNVSMISWMVTILEGCGCVLSWHSRSCCHCCVDSSVSWSYLSVLVKSTCLAAFQNKYLTFGVGRLVFVGPTLCKNLWCLTESYLEHHQKILLVRHFQMSIALQDPG